MISSLSRAYERTEEMQKRGIFANLFLLQNRLQALFDHDPRNLGVTLKQFLLLVMVRRLPAGGNHVYAPGRAFGLFAAKCQNPGLPAGPQTAGGAASASVRWARHVRGPFAGCRTVFCQKRRLPQRSAGYAVCLLYPRRAFVPVSADGQAAHRHPGPLRPKKGGCAPCMRFF